MKSFGELIRKAREEKNYILRQVSAGVGIDQAIISKFERGERKPTKEQVIRFAIFFELNEDELIVAWLSDKLIYDLKNESLAEEALKVADEKIKYYKTQANGK